MEVFVRNKITQKANLIRKARKLYKEANSLYRKASAMANAVPEPSLYLIGNYFGSENFNYCKRLDELYDEADALLKKAAFYQRKANAIKTS